MRSGDHVAKSRVQSVNSAAQPYHAPLTSGARAPIILLLTPRIFRAFERIPDGALPRNWGHT